MNLLKKKISPIILTISFLLLLYIFYKSEIIWDGDNRKYYKTYYLISTILICFSIITFFINEKIKQYLIISGISLIVSLYLFEGYLTIDTELLKQQLLKEQLYEKQTGKKWDTRDKFEIYTDLKKINNKIVISTPPPRYFYKENSIMPLSIMSNSETIHCSENGYYSIYQSDRYGFNNPDNEWDEKEIEYLLVGDSFTHGACVNRPNDIGSVLRNLSNKSVLNLGIHGNGPLTEYATLREYLDKNVKKVLWIYYENDLTDLKNELQNNDFIKYINDLNFTQNLRFKQNKIESFLSNQIKKRDGESSKLMSFIKIHKIRKLFLPKPLTASATEFKQILQLTKELVNKNNSKLYFVYLPSYYRYQKNYNNTNYNNTNSNLIKKILTELKIPFIDIHEKVFKKEQDPLKLFPFGLFGHYNVYGYKKVAETIYKFTKD